MDKTAYRGPLQKIGRVWIAKGYRHHGIASLTVKAMVKILGQEFLDIGWELPLTADGKALLQRLVSSWWWGCGDPDVLRATLDASQ